MTTENKKEWAVLCPGPSLKNWDNQKFENQRIIAVNNAVLFNYRYINYWCVLDLDTMFEMVFREIRQIPPYNFCLSSWRPGMILWAPERWEEDIKHYDKEIQSFYQQFLHELFDVQEDFASIYNIIPRDPEYDWWNYTLFTALALAIIKGANRINIYGADMGGKGYFRPGFDNYRLRHDEKRWAQERRLFTLFQAIFGSRGISIERVTAPDKENSKV